MATGLLIFYFFKFRKYSKIKTANYFSASTRVKNTSLLSILSIF